MSVEDFWFDMVGAFMDGVGVAVLVPIIVRNAWAIWRNK